LSRSTRTLLYRQSRALLAQRGIRAVPVVDKDNRVIGMVSEGDLLHRAETGTERRRAWWVDMMASTNKLAGDYIKSHSGKVKDVMTRNVLSVTEATPIADIRPFTGDEPDQARSRCA
jgi:CBS-domain-containing membrane protein